MKFSKKNMMFTLVAAVLLGWGIFYTNCGTQQNVVDQAIEESGPKSMGTQAMSNCYVTGAGGPTETAANNGYTCMVWYHCSNGGGFALPGTLHAVNGVANAECCAMNDTGMACSLIGESMSNANQHDVDVFAPTSTSTPTPTSKTSTTKTK